MVAFECALSRSDEGGEGGREGEAVVVKVVRVGVTVMVVVRARMVVVNGGFGY